MEAVVRDAAAPDLCSIVLAASLRPASTLDCTGAQRPDLESVPVALHNGLASITNARCLASRYPLKFRA